MLPMFPTDFRVLQAAVAPEVFALSERSSRTLSQRASRASIRRAGEEENVIRQKVGIPLSTAILHTAITTILFILSIVTLGLAGSAISQTKSLQKQDLMPRVGSLFSSEIAEIAGGVIAFLAGVMGATVVYMKPLRARVHQAVSLVIFLIMVGAFAVLGFGISHFQDLYTTIASSSNVQKTLSTTTQHVTVEGISCAFHNISSINTKSTEYSTLCSETTASRWLMLPVSIFLLALFIIHINIVISEPQTHTEASTLEAGTAAAAAPPEAEKRQSTVLEDWKSDVTTINGDRRPARDEPEEVEEVEERSAAAVYSAWPSFM